MNVNPFMELTDVFLNDQGNSKKLTKYQIYLKKMNKRLLSKEKSEYLFRLKSFHLSCFFVNDCTIIDRYDRMDIKTVTLLIEALEINGVV